MRRSLACTVLLAACLAACAAPLSMRPSPPPDAAGAGAGSADGAPAVPSVQPSEPLRLVTLGDAYTAGTDTLAPKRDSWPAQLVAAMEHADVRLRLVGNLAESGQTSEDVIRSQLPQVEALAPDVVTLQVGVNDIIARDISLDDYRKNVSDIVASLVRILPAERVFLITTPDHTLTTRGADWGSRESGHADVIASNAILEQVGSTHGVTVIDISPVNRRVLEDASLVIGEGPYPTAKQYAGWVEVIGPAIHRVLSAGEP